MDPTKRYAWHGEEGEEAYTYESRSTSNTKATGTSPVRDPKTKETDKEKKAAKKEPKEDKEEKETTKEKDKKAAKKEKEPKKKKQQGIDSGSPAPDALVKVVDVLGKERLIEVLEANFPSFQGTDVYKKDKKRPPDGDSAAIQHYYMLDRKSKGHQKFREFCVKSLCEKDLDCLDAFSEVLEESKDYIAFMNLFHEAYEKFLKPPKPTVYFEKMETLQGYHDKYWNAKTGTPKKLSEVDD